MGNNQEKSKLYDLDERSFEVKEIMGQMPSWIIRWGITLLLGILLLLLIGSALISYNDIISANITITTKLPPAYIEAKLDGRLNNIFVSSNQLVDREEILAEIENTANLNDVMLIKKAVLSFMINLADFDSLEQKFPSNLKLGLIQNSYINFRLKYQNYLSYNILKPEKNEINNLRQQYANQLIILQQRKNQLKSNEIELKGSLESYNDYKSLFNKGVISKHEFLNHEKSYLSDKRLNNGIRASILNSQNALNIIVNRIDKTSIDDKTSFLSTEQSLLVSIQNLKNEILSWEQLYLLKSPIKGKVSLFDIRSKYHNLKAGDIILTVVPSKIDSLIGYATTPIKNSGKLKVGQTVIIKLDNYPYQEWGSLNGTISTISNVPKQAQYSIYIDVNGLTTSYNKKIEFKQEMQGVAEIITEELSILQRIFYQSRKIFNTK